MTAESERLRQTLDKLHAELESVAVVDPEVRALLEDAVQEIHDTLDEGGDDAEPAAEEKSVAERLGEAARHFEDSHPTVSMTLGRIIDILGQMGI